MRDHDRSRKLCDDGRAALEAGDRARAIELLAQSVAASPHLKTLELLGEQYLLEGEPGKAVVPVAAASSLNARVRAPSLLAEAFLALGEVNEARQFAEQVLATAPGNKRAKRVLSALTGA